MLTYEPAVAIDQRGMFPVGGQSRCCSLFHELAKHAEVIGLPNSTLLLPLLNCCFSHLMLHEQCCFRSDELLSTARQKSSLRESEQCPSSGRLLCIARQEGCAGGWVHVSAVFQFLIHPSLPQV